MLIFLFLAVIYLSSYKVIRIILIHSCSRKNKANNRNVLTVLAEHMPSIWSDTSVITKTVQT